MARKNLGTLTVDLVAKMGGFIDGMSKAERAAYKSMRGVKKEVSNTDKAMKALNKGAGLLAGAIASIAGVTVGMVTSQANAAREVLNLSDALGISTQQLTAGAYAAKQLGIEQDKYADIVKDVSDKVGDFLTTGGGPMADFFETVAPKVGVTADMFRDLNGADALQLYVSSLEEANLSQNEMAFFMEAIASDATMLLPLLRDNGAEMKRYSEEAKALGVVLDQDTAEGAKRFDEALERVKGALFGNYELLNTFAPVMDDFADAISDPQTIEGLKNLVEGVGGLAQGLITVTTEAANFAKWVGETIAASVHGAAIDDIVRLQDELEDLEKQLDRAKKYRDAGDAALIAVTDPMEIARIQSIIMSIDGLEKKVKETKEKIALSNPEPLKPMADSAKDAEKEVRKLADTVTALTGKTLVGTEKMQSAVAAVGEEIRTAQGYWNEFGFWENGQDPFAVVERGVSEVSAGYGELSMISNGVMTGLVTDADSAFDSIGRNFQSLLGRMADDALRNAINVQVGVEGQGGSSGGGTAAGGALAAAGWWAVVAVAVAAVADQWNDEQDEKFANVASEIRQQSQGTGTLLGDLNAKSQSLNNLIEELESTSSDALSVNYDMLRTLQDIRSGLMGVAEGFARSGFGSISGDAFSAYEFGSFLANATERHNIWTPTSNGTLVSMGLEHNILSAQERYGINRSHITGNPIDYAWEQAGVFGLDEYALGLFDGLAESIAKNIYRERTDLLDSGIEIFGGTLADIIDGGLLDAQAYADISTEKKLFGLSISKDLDTLYAMLDDQTRQQLTGVYLGAYDALEIASSSFGLDIAEFLPKLLIDGTRLSLENLEPDELAGEIESFFSAQFDQWAEVILDGTGVLQQYQQVGEGAFETMLRLSAETEYYTDIVDRLGFNFEAAGLAAVNATQAVADAAGGFEALTSNLQTFISNFVSEEQQLAMVTDQLTGIFDTLGITLPTTADGFYDLVSSIDQTTAEGAELYTTLLGLSQPMAQYLAALEKEEAEKQRLADLMTDKNIELLRLQGREEEALALQREKELAAMDDSMHSIQLRIWALEDEKAAMAQLQSNTDSALDVLRKSTGVEIDRLTTEFEGISAGLRAEYDAKAESLNKWLDTQLSHYERRAAALNDSIAELTDLSGALESAMSIVRGQLGGGVEDYTFSAAGIDALAQRFTSTGNLPGAAEVERYTAGLSGAEQFFSTEAEFKLAQAAISRDLDLLQGGTDEQLSIEERMLASLEGRSEQAQRNHDRMLARYDAQFAEEMAAAEAQYQQQVEGLQQQLKYFEEQVNLLRGIDDNIPGIERAVQQMQVNLAAEQAAGRKENSEALTRVQLALESVSRNTSDTTDAIELLVRELQGAA